MSKEFIAFDVETANEDVGSICQLGFAHFNNNGELVKEYSQLVDPDDDFSELNTRIHGINSGSVRYAKEFPSYYQAIKDAFTGNVIVHHTSFDKTSLNKACDSYGLPRIDCNWLDSSKIARRAWDDVAKRGYGLSDLAYRVGYDFKHHDALEDAKAAAAIIHKILDETDTDITYWLERVGKPIGTIKQAGNVEGVLYGEVICFTGSLSMSRSEAAALAATAGCNVGTGVTKKTTLLVVGDQDLDKLSGHEKSSKHRKAETLISKGIPIRIISEMDFKGITFTKKPPEPQTKWQKNKRNVHKSEQKNKLEAEVCIKEEQVKEAEEALFLYNVKAGICILIAAFSIYIIVTT